MIKGLSSGYRGPIYIYYRGKQQLVLSDVHAGFNLGADLAGTALRVVLHPGQWTETDFSYVAEAFNEHRGQLFYLERDGYVDIYTDKAEVDALKQGKTLEQVHVEEAQHQPAPQTQKYFNMQMFTGNQTQDASVPVQQVPVQSQPAPLPANDMLESLKKQQDLMQQQMQAMTEMTKAMANMMNKFSEKLDTKE